MDPAIRGSLVVGDADPIYNEAFNTFQVASTKYAEILPAARPKIPKLKSTLGINNIMPLTEFRLII